MFFCTPYPKYRLHSLVMTPVTIGVGVMTRASTLFSQRVRQRVWTKEVSRLLKRWANLQRGNDERKKKQTKKFFFLKSSPLKKFPFPIGRPKNERVTENFEKEIADDFLFGLLQFFFLKVVKVFKNR